MSQKIQISKAGIDAGTATAPNDLIFSSDYNTLKYHQSGSIAVGWAGDTSAAVEGTVNHNLGYYPFFTAFVEEVNGTQFYHVPYSMSEWYGAISFFTYATADDLIFRAELSSAYGIDAGTVRFYYKIFRNNLDL